MDIVRLKEKLGNIPDPRRPWRTYGINWKTSWSSGRQRCCAEGKISRIWKPSGRSRKRNCGCFWNCPGGYRTGARFSGYFSGKTIQGSSKNPVHVVSAWVGEEQIVLGQAAADEKSNEITVVPKLLRTKVRGLPNGDSETDTEAAGGLHSGGERQSEDAA